uniref:C-type lectin domain-containing protein n=1 Tax=Oryzias latipes TaxID=8090 RepID=A0A3B3H9A4_ORYLA
MPSYGQKNVITLIRNWFSKRCFPGRQNKNNILQKFEQKVVTKLKNDLMKLHIPPRVKETQFKIMNDIYPSKELLRLLFNIDDNCCSFCQTKWIRFGTSCYFLSGESKSWDEARESCRTRGADLVVINTEEENMFLSALKKQKFWIGLSDRDLEGTWKWVDGSSLTPQFWEENQPDNGGGMVAYGEEDCVEIRFIPGSWNDISCETSLRWICEKEATLFELF